VQAKLKQLVELFNAIAKRIGQVMQDIAKSIKEKINRLLSRAEKEAGNFDATPGGPNRHGQGDKAPPPDKRPKPKLTGLQTEPGTAFFWSGRTRGSGGKERAAEVATGKGGETLEMLIEKRGIKMPDWDDTNPESVKAWSDISREFAAGASGEVRAVLGENVRANSIWLREELPALKRNLNVTKITAIDPKTLVETVVFAR
jgi:hypothetical protein